MQIWQLETQECAAACGFQNLVNQIGLTVKSYRDSASTPMIYHIWSVGRTYLLWGAPLSDRKYAGRWNLSDNASDTILAKAWTHSWSACIDLASSTVSLYDRCEVTLEPFRMAVLVELKGGFSGSLSICVFTPGKMVRRDVTRWWRLGLTPCYRNVLSVHRRNLLLDLFTDVCWASPVSCRSEAALNLMIETIDLDSSRHDNFRCSSDP